MSSPPCPAPENLDTTRSGSACPCLPLLLSRQAVTTRTSNPIIDDMKLESKYFDKIRIKPRGGKKREEPMVQQCQWESCVKPGPHRAPLGRQHEGQYIRFCLEHVREYNRTYNYFSGLDDDAVQRFHKDAQTGHRPTWKMGVDREGQEATEERQRDVHSAARAQARGHRNAYLAAGDGPAATNDPRNRKLKPLEKKSFGVLGIAATTEAGEITARYKDLVKRHHPDSNGGDRSTEDRLSQIIQSYKILKQSGFCG